MRVQADEPEPAIPTRRLELGKRQELRPYQRRRSGCPAARRPAPDLPDVDRLPIRVRDSRSVGGLSARSGAIRRGRARRGSLPVTPDGTQDGRWRCRLQLPPGPQLALRVASPGTRRRRRPAARIDRLSTALVTIVTGREAPPPPEPSPPPVRGIEDESWPRFPPAGTASVPARREEWTITTSNRGATARGAAEPAGPNATA